MIKSKWFYEATMREEYVLPSSDKIIEIGFFRI